MRRIDISMPLYPGMPAFPGDPPFETARLRALDRGDPYNISTVVLGSHAGTHVDPPAHFVRDGVTADRLDLDALNGPCWVVEVDSRVTAIGVREVDSLPAGAERVLFRTSNSSRWARSLSFFADYVALSPPAAEALAARKVALVGVDSLSIENDPSGRYPVHHLLLGRGIVLLEGLLLEGVAEGEYTLECLPLRLRDGDGGPARAALIVR